MDEVALGQSEVEVCACEMEYHVHRHHYYFRADFLVYEADDVKTKNSDDRMKEKVGLV